MKNQYFGDVNDFRKYGLLRALTGCIDSQQNKKIDLTLAVCWMLTPDDNTSHGNRTDYLKLPLPNIYSNLDYNLFNYFCKLDIISGNNRDVKKAQNEMCLPISSLFYYQHVPPDKNDRAQFFNKFMKQAERFDIIFYDPDNGINVKTHHYGTMYSTKYLYWCELFHSYSNGHSIILYQHFGMQPGGRDLFIENMANDLKKSIGIEEIYTFKSAHVVFFLLPQPKHRVVFEKRIEYLRENWSSNRMLKNSLLTSPLIGAAYKLKRCYS
jgi:hypothetical protein